MSKTPIFKPGDWVQITFGHFPPTTVVAADDTSVETEANGLIWKKDVRPVHHDDAEAPMFQVGQVLRDKRDGVPLYTKDGPIAAEVIRVTPARELRGWTYEVQVAPGQRSHGIHSSFAHQHLREVQMARWDFSVTMGHTERYDTVELPDYYTEDQVREQYQEWVLRMTVGGYSLAEEEDDE